jgi:hypothetical protein
VPTGSTIKGAYNPNGLIIENVEIGGVSSAIGPFQAINLTNCSNVVLRHLNISNVVDGGYGVGISSSSDDQSYDIFIENVIVSAATSDSTANGFVFDGKVTTMAIIRTAVLNGNIAYSFTNNVGAASGPGNVFGFRVGCDFSNQGIYIDGAIVDSVVTLATNFEIFDCHVHCDPPAGTTKPEFYFGQYATQFGAWGGQVKGAGGNGLEIAGTDFVWHGIQEVSENSKGNADLYDGILIDGTASNVEIQGYLGKSADSIGRQRYGVTIQPGATNIRVEGYLDDNQAGPFLNQSVDENIDIVNLSSLPRDHINRAVNGGFEIWQRGTTFAIPASTTMPVADRFHATTSALNGSTVSQAIPGLSNGSKYCLRFQRNGTQTGTGFLVLEQAYDAADIVPFHGERVSARVMVRGGANYSGGVCHADVRQACGG